MSDMSVDLNEWFLADWEKSSQFGSVEGTTGVDRQAGTAADAEHRRWFERLMREHGFTVLRDAVGNMFALYELVPGAPYVVTGSHLDSQPTAGRFDGAYGVVASCHAAFRLIEEHRRDALQPTFNLAVVNWFNEEGSRFKPSLMGSSVFTGKLAETDALTTTDSNGVRVVDALDSLNERGEFRSQDLPVASYVEIHVEQGRSMEEQGVAIGLVKATWAAQKYEVRLLGEQAHTGSTLMAERRDALLGAAHVIVAVSELVNRVAPGTLHTSVSEMRVYPNSPVVVASDVHIHVDLRSPDAEVIKIADQYLRETLSQVCENQRIEVEIVGEHSWDQHPYTPEGIELARSAAERLRLPYSEVLTVAGHDSTNMKDKVPTVMLFVPSVEGISHNVNEFTKDEDLLNGVEMMTEVVRRLVVGDLAAGE